MNKGEEENLKSANDATSVKIYMAFDLDYCPEDYEVLPDIFKVIEDTPATFFIIGSRHPIEPVKFPKNCEIGNHSKRHEEWSGTHLIYRIDDLLVNHNFIKKRYGFDCKVYRSPHLRNYNDTKFEMVKHGYLPEMECAKCVSCDGNQYFSSHHYFQSGCAKGFVQGFEELCKVVKDFTFFLDPRHFDSEERLKNLKEIIIIGKKYGEFRLLSDNKSI